VTLLEEDRRVKSAHFNYIFASAYHNHSTHKTLTAFS